MVIAGALLSGCIAEDGPEYDVPARKQFSDAQLEVDADGSLVILAGVNLNYGTKAKLDRYDQKYRTPNVETVIYTGEAGAWESHPFRNLQPGYGSKSFLARNGKGEIQPMIWNRNGYTLFARSGGDWIPKANFRKDGLAYLSNYYAGGFGPDMQSNIILTGDSLWQSVAPYFTSHSDVLVSNRGAVTVLDTSIQFFSRAGFTGKENSVIVGVGYPWDSRLDTVSGTYCYILSRDPAAPEPRRQLLFRTSGFVKVIFARISGEDRFYIPEFQDSLNEYAIRGKEVIRLGRIATGSEHPADSVPGPRSSYTDFINRISVGPDRCVDILSPIVPPYDSVKYNSEAESYRHTNSCRSGEDTLYFPTETLLHKGPVLASEIRYAADGNPMVLFTFVEQWNQFYGNESVIGASWLYLAKLSSGGKWAWEKVAEY